jgi:hypothetical protein
LALTPKIFIFTYQKQQHMKKFYFLPFALFILTLATRAQVSNNPGICMVTVDDSSKHNIVYYDKTQFAVADTFILWRESNTTPGTYVRVMANPSSAISMFLDMDTAADPNIKLHRYKFQVYDNVNGYSQLGPYHTVLFCLQNVQNYNWNLYDIEGVGTGQVVKYYLLRDDNSLNQWHVIDSVSGTINNTTDPLVALYPNGQWRLSTKWSLSCTPTARYAGNNQNQTTIVKSKSNITNNRNAGIYTLRPSSVVLYPNPASASVTLRLSFPQAKATTVKLFDMLGSEVKSFTMPAGKDEISFDVRALPKGIYVVELNDLNTKITKRLAVE